MPASNNRKHFEQLGKKQGNMDDSSFNNQLNSDNAFSDNGLENASLLEKALNKTNSK